MIRSVSRWWLGAAVLLCSSGAFASWMQYSLPNLTYSYGGTALGHLPDGRYVFGECGNLYLQDAWNSSFYTPFSTEPSFIDPSFIAIWDGTFGVIGAGGAGYSELYAFNPGNTASLFSNVGTNYNFQGALLDAGSILVNGASWTQPTNTIYYMTLDGATNKLVLDGVSLYSAGMTLDGSGNLYVADNDDGSVYKFTPLQLDAAITGAPLTLASGQFVHDFGDGGNVGSIAVDGLGRIWTAGWNQEGLKVYNPSLDQEFSYTPALANANYKVATFSSGGTNYVAYLNQADPGHSGTAQTYGFDLADLYAIPEPGTLALMGLAGLIVGIRTWLRKWNS